ncbi:hypothetical protein BVG79_02418 [Ketogulonicigenium robustum]|uniref:L,D-TPase catalytic domain-containing protein n=1 Tax=Ketogulonicigenium robustum TaxID=92947 RepID=A0A1W6P2L6_9RHOB|nr:L,D-transpeptidase family protein [Ketogulonicigenium robustum]ARO15758.1 hypothetical protein BVG79_02418 [Ketogulonicigenium robustum]
MGQDTLWLTPMGLLWRGQRIACTIGRGGLVADKREGDGATPFHTLRLNGLWYRPDRLARPAPWARPIGPLDLWSDDSAAPDYNQPVRAPYAPSHERLRRADPMYDLVLTTDWNMDPAVPGRGSAIFLHQWRRRGAPTAGCIAMARGDLIRLCRQVQPGTPLRITGMRLANRTRGTIFDA